MEGTPFEKKNQPLPGVSGFDNLFSLYSDAPGAEEATLRCSSLIAAFAKELDIWRRQCSPMGATDTESRDAVCKYVLERI